VRSLNTIPMPLCYLDDNHIVRFKDFF